MKLPPCTQGLGLRLAIAGTMVAAMAGAALAQDMPTIVTPANRACVPCHSSDAEGGLRIVPAAIEQWEMSLHSKIGVGCVECHGMPKAGDLEDIDNPRYVVETVWNQEPVILSCKNSCQLKPRPMVARV